MSLNSPNGFSDFREGPTPAELAANFNQWRVEQQRKAEERNPYRTRLSIGVSDSSVKSERPLLQKPAPTPPLHYQPSRRTWEVPQVLETQQRLLAVLPQNAAQLPKELLEINTGNGIQAYGDTTYQYDDGHGERRTDHHLVASLTKEVASSAFAQAPAYDVREESFDGDGMRKVIFGRLKEIGIGAGDAVIKIVRDNRTSYYHAITGELIADPYASEVPKTVSENQNSELDEAA